MRSFSCKGQPLYFAALPHLLLLPIVRSAHGQRRGGKDVGQFLLFLPPPPITVPYSLWNPISRNSDKYGIWLPVTLPTTPVSLGHGLFPHRCHTACPTLGGQPLLSETCLLGHTVLLFCSLLAMLCRGRVTPARRLGFCLLRLPVKSQEWGEMQLGTENATERFLPSNITIISPNCLSSLIECGRQDCLCKNKMGKKHSGHQHRGKQVKSLSELHVQ